MVLVDRKVGRDRDACHGPNSFGVGWAGTGSLLANQSPRLRGADAHLRGRSFPGWMAWLSRKGLGDELPGEFQSSDVAFRRSRGDPLVEPGILLGQTVLRLHVKVDRRPEVGRIL